MSVAGRSLSDRFEGSSHVYSIAMGRKGLGLLPFSAVAPSISACVHTGFIPATTLRMPPREEGCHLDMIFHGDPPHSYVVIGRVTTDSTAPGLFAIGEGNEVAIRRLQGVA